MMLSSQQLEQLILTNYKQKIEKWQEIIERRSRSCQNNHSNYNNNNKDEDWSQICNFLIEVFGEHCELQRSLGDYYGTLLSSLVDSKQKIGSQFKQENKKKKQIMTQLIAQTTYNTKNTKCKNEDIELTSPHFAQEQARRQPQVQPQPHAQSQTQVQVLGSVEKQVKTELEESYMYSQIESKKAPNTCNNINININYINSKHQQVASAGGCNDEILEKIFKNYESMVDNSSLTDLAVSPYNNKNNNSNNNNSNNSNNNNDNNNNHNGGAGLNSWANKKIEKIGHFSMINNCALSNGGMFVNSSNGITRDKMKDNYKDNVTNSKCITNKKIMITKSKNSNKSNINNTNVNNKLFVCGDCGRKFKLQRNLIAHARIHKGLGFECQHCSKAFARKSNLTQHLRIQLINYK